MPLTDHAAADAMRAGREFRCQSEATPSGGVDRGDRGIHGCRTTHPWEQIVHHVPLTVISDGPGRSGEAVAGKGSGDEHVDHLRSGNIRIALRSEDTDWRLA